MKGYNSMAMGLNVRYFIKDYEGVRVLGSTKTIIITLLAANLFTKSSKFSINFIVKQIIYISQ